MTAVSLCLQGYSMRLTRMNMMNYRGAMTSTKAMKISQLISHGRHDRTRVAFHVRIIHKNNKVKY